MSCEVNTRKLSDDIIFCTDTAWYLAVGVTGRKQNQTMSSHYSLRECQQKSGPTLHSACARMSARVRANMRVVGGWWCWGGGEGGWG